MPYPENSDLSTRRRLGPFGMLVASAALGLACLAPQWACAEEKSAPKRDELDVTMQIIVDPDTKLPDEVVRRIPLPARKPTDESKSKPAQEHATPDAAAKGQQRASEAQEQGREMAESAKDRAREAAAQREQAGRVKAEERREQPPHPPTPPPRQPGR